MFQVNNKNTFEQGNVTWDVSVIYKPAANQWTGFYMIGISIMEELIIQE